jgi:hypothetical protein
MPSSALAEVSETLRHLNLTGNHIQPIDYCIPCWNFE